MAQGDPCRCAECERRRAAAIASGKAGFVSPHPVEREPDVLRSLELPTRWEARPDGSFRLVVDGSGMSEERRDALLKALDELWGTCRALAVDDEVEGDPW